MKHIALLTLASLLILASSCSGKFRYIHNCDGTDLLGNFQNGHRPLSVADVNSYVDRFCEGGATTLMACSGSDFTYYRSKYGRISGDDLNGTLDNCGDTMILSYYQNFLNLEAEGSDYIRCYLERVKKNGKEAFITYRMNDLHFNDPKIPVPVYASDFWKAHPEYHVGGDSYGWNSQGALNFAFPEVRQQKYNMIAEQLNLYGDVLDGFEMDFCRFVVYFPLGEGPANMDRMTSLVRKVRAKADSVGREKGHRILLTVRVPDTWVSCINNGLDVRTWVRDGLVDFVTLAVHWKGDPAIDVDLFRKESGIGKRIPVYATVDDGTYKPREQYTHSQMRGAASYALSHGADGIYLFNYFYDQHIAGGGGPVVRNGLFSRSICPSLMKELGSLETLEGRNKSYSYYSANSEYALGYKSPMPLHPSMNCDEELSFTIADRTLPRKAYLFYRATAGSHIGIIINGRELKHCPEDAGLPELFGRDKSISGFETGIYIIPENLLLKGNNSVIISTSAVAVTIDKLELVLDYGDIAAHGLF